MAKNKGKTIAIKAAGEPPRKLTKVKSYPGKGKGFQVLMPYHCARSGVVTTVPVDYNMPGGIMCSVSHSECISFTAEDRVKLSYHGDGFAQFSGEVGGKIISGRDPITKEPKGVGLMTYPLILQLGPAQAGVCKRGVWRISIN